MTGCASRGGSAAAASPAWAPTFQMPRLQHVACAPTGLTQTPAILHSTCHPMRQAQVKPGLGAGPLTACSAAFHPSNLVATLTPVHSPSTTGASQARPGRRPLGRLLSLLASQPPPLPLTLTPAHSPCIRCKSSPAWAPTLRPPASPTAPPASAAAAAMAASEPMAAATAQPSCTAGAWAAWAAGPPGLCGVARWCPARMERAWSCAHLPARRPRRWVGVAVPACRSLSLQQVCCRA